VDNQTVIAGGWDYGLLDLDIQDIQLELPDLDLKEYGFDIKTNGKIPELPPEIDESIAEGVKEVECPKCGHKFPL